MDVTVLNLNGSESSDGTGAFAEPGTEETLGTIDITTTEQKITSLHSAQRSEALGVSSP